MRKQLSFLLMAAAMLTIMFSCQKQEKVSQDAISEDVLAAIGQAGFSTTGVVKDDDGYIVEGDIFLSSSMLASKPGWRTMTIAETEQYHTTNTVAGTRTIKVSISNKLPSSYIAALDEALARYNAENLVLTFQRVSSGADISLVSGNGSYLASAGFPTSSGNPYGQVKINSRAIGNQPQSTVASIIAHELGHCIGYRHTDYMNRSYSCGGSPTNEGASTVGAVHIPGTPTGPDSGSWMLSCIGSGQNRPFNNNDKTALNYLY
jgi:Dual-action HEIGH metallo-peptidase